jgi:hypothetical protein
MGGGANILAWTALALCAPVSLFIIARWRAAVSVPIVIIAGQMFLPPSIGFELPFLPALDKDILPPLSALVGCLLFRRSALAGSRPGRGLDVFILLRIVSYFGSCMTNRDALVFPQGVVPALSVTSFITTSLRTIAYWWPTVYLGRSVIKTSRDLRTLLVILAGSAVIYTAFILLEMRLSPQLNNWIYGYYQSDFIQSVRRGGSYRPMVFMRHGLNVSFFLAVTIIAAIALARVRGRVFGVKAGIIAGYLFVILLLSRSLGAIIYVVLAGPLMWFGRARTQTRVAALLGLLAFSYPLARATGLVPVADITAFVTRNFGEDKAGSLGLRLREEEYLMNRTMERPVFGWGGGARSFRLDPVTGQSRSVTDGLWAMEFGQEGAVGYVLFFGMLLYPVWKARKTLPGLPSAQDEKLVASLAFVGAIYIVDLIPNSSVDPYLTFLVAVLSGVVRRGLAPDEPDPRDFDQAYS